MKTREIIATAQSMRLDPMAFYLGDGRVLQLIEHLAERVAALEAREETRERVKLITEGRKPEPGLGR